MSEEVESLVLRYLRRIDEKVDRLAGDVSDLKLRMTNCEQQIAALSAMASGQYASVSTRLDRIEARLDRIERRLDLVETR
jgi:site-specific recombinase